MTNPTHAPENMANAAGERAKGYVDSGVSAFNVAAEKARQLTQSADGCVRDNPWMAIGAAASVGILIGYLLRGRRGD